MSKDSIVYPVHAVLSNVLVSQMRYVIDNGSNLIGSLQIPTGHFHEEEKDEGGGNLTKESDVDRIADLLRMNSFRRHLGPLEGSRKCKCFIGP